MSKKPEIDSRKEFALQQEPIEHLVISGGGAKGTILTGAVDAMEKAGVRAGLKVIAGTSVGAITSGLIATGISGEDLKNLFQNTNLNDLQGEGIIQKDAKPLYDLMHNTINDNITKYFARTNMAKKCEMRLNVLLTEHENLQSENLTSSSEEIKKLNKQIQQLTDIIEEPTKLVNILAKANNNGNVTFSDLNIMNIIDPVTFKELVVTATNKTTGELKFFDFEATPDVEIALACRASASLPLRFEPVTIDGEQYVDGGYRNNIPINYFEDKKNIAQDITDSVDMSKEPPKKRTLVLVFGSQDDNSPAHVAVYSSQEKITNFSKIKKFMLNVVLKFIAKIGGDFEHTADKDQGFEKVRENALNTIILDTKDVSTLDFKKAGKKAKYLHEKGKIQTARYFNNHGIGNNQDINLEQKEFILKIYEETQFPSSATKLTNLAMGNKLDNSEFILDLCKDRTWEKNSKTEILASLLAKSVQTNAENKYSTNTHMMNKIVEVLNESTTPSSVKNDYIKLLNIKITGKESDYQFQTQDFNQFVKKNISRASNKSADKNKSFVHKLLVERKLPPKGVERQ